MKLNYFNLIATGCIGALFASMFPNTPLLVIFSGVACSVFCQILETERR
jgi:hypothetical protein